MTQAIGQKFTPFSLLKFAFPSMVMMVFMSLYTIVDGIFISRYVGSHALSSVNIVYPMLNLLLAVGIMLATGGSAIVAMEMGEDRPERARGHFSFFVAVGLLVSVLFLIVGVLFGRNIAYILGANANLIEHCNTYLKILMIFAPACMLQALFQAFFVAAGKPRLGLGVTILGGVANAVLDYIFMGPLNMGVAGAAIATGIGQTIPAIVGLLYFGFGKGELRFVKFAADMRSLLQACINGSSEMVTNISGAVVTYLFNITMMRIAGEEGVAAITIIMYAQFLFNAMYFGFSMGTAPVLSFRYGAKDSTQLQWLSKICTRFVVFSSVAVTLLSFVSAKLVVGIFVARDSTAYEITVPGFIIFAFSYLFSGYNIYSSSFFTALSDGKTSAIISFTRTFGCIVASLLILPRIIGINGVWLAVPIAELLTCGLSYYFQRKEKKVIKEAVNLYHKTK